MQAAERHLPNAAGLRDEGKISAVGITNGLSSTRAWMAEPRGP